MSTILDHPLETRELIYHYTGDTDKPQSIVLPSPWWYHGKGSKDLQILDSQSALALTCKSFASAATFHDESAKHPGGRRSKPNASLQLTSTAITSHLDWPSMDLTNYSVRQRAADQFVVSPKDVWVVPPITASQEDDRKAMLTDRSGMLIHLMGMLRERTDMGKKNIVVPLDKTASAVDWTTIKDFIASASPYVHDRITQLSLERPDCEWHWEPVPTLNWKGEPNHINLQKPLPAKCSLYLDANMPISFGDQMSETLPALISAKVDATIRFFMSTEFAGKVPVQDYEDFGEDLGPSSGGNQEIGLYIGGGRRRKDVLNAWLSAAPTVSDRLASLGYPFKIHDLFDVVFDSKSSGKNGEGCRQEQPASVGGGMEE